MPRLIWVFAGRTLILLVLSCRGSYTVFSWCSTVTSKDKTDVWELNTLQTNRQKFNKSQVDPTCLLCRDETVEHYILECLTLRHSQGFGGGGTGEQGHFFQGNKGLKIRGTQTIFGNMEHRKSRFCFGGNKAIFRREQGNRYPHGRASTLDSVRRLIIHSIQKITGEFFDQLNSNFTFQTDNHRLLNPFKPWEY